MSEARRLQAEELQHRTASAVRDAYGPDAAAVAMVRVGADGRLSVACSCGAGLYHPSGRPDYTLDRLKSHMALHATAAREGVPWDEVEKRLAALAYRQGVQERSARLLPVERAPRDDDPGE